MADLPTVSDAERPAARSGGRRYPSDVSDDEWAFVAPYLTLLPEAAGQRRHDPREVFNAVRYLVRTGAPWRYLPVDFPPWAAVYQQPQRWLAHGCFPAIAHDLRSLLRVAAGRASEPTAAVLDACTLRSSRESGPRAGYDGHPGIEAPGVHSRLLKLLRLAPLRALRGERRRTPAGARHRAGRPYPGPARPGSTRRPRPGL